MKHALTLEVVSDAPIRCPPEDALVPWAGRAVTRELLPERRTRRGPEELLRGEQLGDLFDAHQERLYRLARRMAGDREEARDLVQETFLRAVRSRRSLPASAPGREAWLVRTLVNLCRDRYRRLSVREQKVEDPAPAASRFPDPESAAVARVLVGGALAQLPPRRRAVVVLHELEDRGVPEIAALLGVAQVTVRWHLSAGRQSLRRILMRGRPAPRGG